MNAMTSLKRLVLVGLVAVGLGAVWAPGASVQPSRQDTARAAQVGAGIQIAQDKASDGQETHG